MPKRNIDYSKTTIYKFVCKDLKVTDCYVGHTTNFTQRKSQHKDQLRLGNKFKIYSTMRENGGWDNWEMIEIETVNCRNNNEARAKERVWYENLNSNLNMVKPFRTTEEKKQYDIEFKIQHPYKIYYENNKEKIIQKVQKYKNENREQYYKKCQCDCGGKYIHKNITQHVKTNKHIKYIENIKEVPLNI